MNNKLRGDEKMHSVFSSTSAENLNF